MKMKKKLKLSPQNQSVYNHFIRENDFFSLAHARTSNVKPNSYIFSTITQNCMSDMILNRCYDFDTFNRYIYNVLYIHVCMCICN